jgi:hypothetical protein
VLRTLCACALLLSSCGDDPATPDGGTDASMSRDAPSPDAALDRDACAPSYVPSFVADQLVVPPTSVGFDLNGDGVVDNGLGRLRQFLNPALRDGVRHPPFLLITVFGLDNPVDDPDVEPVMLQGLDADGDPTNDFSGSGAFWFTESSVDPMCRPLGILPPGSLVGGHYTAYSDIAIVPLPIATLVIRRAHLTGDLASDLSGLSNVLVGGAAQPCPLSQAPQTITNQSVLDLLAGTATAWNSSWPRRSRASMRASTPTARASRAKTARAIRGYRTAFRSRSRSPR